MDRALFTDSTRLLLCSIQAMVISRFITNLRRVDSPVSLDASAGHLSDFSLPDFRISALPSFVADMGQPLDHAPSLPSEERHFVDLMSDARWDVGGLEVVEPKDASTGVLSTASSA